MNHPLRLGVNIDHVATLRNARGGTHPCPIRAGLAAHAAGAHGITAHLREDRRHIRDEDLPRLKAEIPLPLNLEMAATAEMQAIALRLRPNAVCLVPEKRTELTTEGGLNVAAQAETLKTYIVPLRAACIRVSLFIDVDAVQVEAAHRIGADIVELHTGAYAEHGSSRLPALQQQAAHAHALGLEVHAGHGLTFDNVGPVAAIPELRELNIGHFLIGEALFTGIGPAVARMRSLMEAARA